MTSPLSYRPEIDGLRAMAVLPVILFHAGIPGFPGGFVGVDVFFVISGYLITSILMAETSAGSFSIMRFYERRARRILPALFAVLAVCIPFAVLWMLPEQLRGFSASLGSVLVFLSNIYFMGQVSYFAPAAELQPLLHTWSLAVEEQYYLIFPLVVFWSMRRGSRRLLVVTLGLTLASLAFSEWGLRQDAERNFFFTLSRFWELGVGSLCAVLLSGRGPWRHEGLALAGIGLTLAPVFLYTAAMPFAGLWALVPVGGAALVVLCAAQGTLAARILSLGPVAGIGLISYSAYLVHQPIFAFARIRSPEELGIPALLLLSGLSLALGWLSWRFVERPFRGQRPAILPARGRYFLACGSVAAALMGVAFTMWANDGFPGRATERYAGEIGGEAFTQYGERFADCQPEAARQAVARYERGRRCLQNRPDVMPTVVVFGDSHAEHLFYGVAEGLTDLNVASYVQNDVPFLGSPRFAPLFNALAENPDLHTVVFSMFWARRLDEFGDDAIFERRLGEVLGYLQSLGVQVLVAGDLPAFASDAAYCKYEVFPGNDHYCTGLRAQAKADQQRYGPMIARVTGALGIKVIPLRDLLCDDAECSMAPGGRMLIRDSNHLNVDGSLLLGGRIAEVIKATSP
jgi:peptidoglycan/LPS O-acetylase OafA/YrhL